MTDKTTKVLLALIAIGLFANVASTAIHPAFAQVDSYLSTIASRLGSIQNGNCNNSKIC